MDVTVARVGAARGLRGEVRLDVRTDSPRTRFVPGAVLRTEPPTAGPLTIRQVREERGSWYVTFAEALDRTAVEALRGVALVDTSTEGEHDAWYPHELVGLVAELGDGTVLGRVEGLEHAPAHDLLVLRERTGERTLVPFVHAIVPVVDVPRGRVVLDPPGGLLAQLGSPDEEPGDVESADDGTPDDVEVDGGEDQGGEDREGDGASAGGSAEGDGGMS